MQKMIQPIPESALPNIARNAVWDIYGKTRAPFPLIVSSVLGAMSLACQHLVDVQRLDGIVTPTSLYLLVLAESGERKSSVDALLMQPVHDYERELRRVYDKELADFKIEEDLWKSKKRLLEGNLRTRKNEESGDVEEIALREHLRAKPEKPVLRKLILTDATPAALQSALTGNGQSIGIISDEAGMIFGGYLIQALALFNSLWSGKRDLTVDRADESYVIRDARVTVLLQVQPPVFGKYLGKHREKAVGSGWLPRFIVTQPISMQGNRFGNGANPGQYGLDSFHRRMNELLRLPVILDEEGNVQRKVLKFAPETQSRWQQIANEIEAMLAPYRYYSGIREFATRFPDNIARLAALFHAFSGNEGDISLDTLNQAVIVFAWYSEEALRLFNRNQLILPEDLEHANLLLQWLQGYFQHNRGEPIRKNILYQRAPNPVRPKGKMNAALNHLLSWGRIQIGKMGKTTYVYPGQNLFTPSI